MTWPMIVITCLQFWAIGVATVQHGQPKKGNESFWVTLIGTLIQCGLFYWAGLYEVSK